MKKILIAAASMLCLNSFTVNAQNNTREANEYRKEVMIQTEQMARDLGLSEDQKKTVMEINMRDAERRKSPKADEKRIQQETEARMKVVLSSDQYKKYLSAKKKETAAEKQ